MFFHFLIVLLSFLL